METLSYRTPDDRIVWVSPAEVETIDGQLVHKGSGQKVVSGRSEKMSKSKLNVVAPAPTIEKYGADTVLFFVLSDSPPEADLHWSDEGVEGSYRFLIRVHHLIFEVAERVRGVAPYSGKGDELSKPARALRQAAHSAFERITKDVDGRFSFNTALARVRELTEALRQASAKPVDEMPADVLAEATHFMIHALGLFAPHLGEELWEGVGGQGILAESRWPEADSAVAAPESITIVVQINGKLRARLTVTPQTGEEEIKASALEQEQVRSNLEGKDVKRVIYVPGRLVNIVAK
jgi:leucyl-tRNA synthetase